MPQLELDLEEATQLKQILNQYLTDLRMEIADTDSKFFRDELHKRKAFIQNIIRRLE